MPAARPGPTAAAEPGEAAAEDSGTTRTTKVAVVEPGPRPARALPARRPGQQGEPFGGTGPEVTISIGHIEVRSAPAAAEPRSRPTFRPQVSLADFLSRDRRP